jgi:hypothetical protein
MYQTQRIHINRSQGNEAYRNRRRDGAWDIDGTTQTKKRKNAFAASPGHIQRGRLGPLKTAGRFRTCLVVLFTLRLSDQFRECGFLAGKKNISLSGKQQTSDCFGPVIFFRL